MTTSPLLHAELVFGAEEDADSSSMGKKHHHAGPEEAVDAVASDAIEESLCEEGAGHFEFSCVWFKITFATFREQYVSPPGPMGPGPRAHVCQFPFSWAAGCQSHQ